YVSYTADADYLALPGDMFGIRTTGDPGPDGLPFAIEDVSPDFNDPRGIILNDALGDGGTVDPDRFFGVVDTVNAFGSDTNTASWTFDISTITSGLTVSADFAAMGNFEIESFGGAFDVIGDVHKITYSIDGATPVVLFETTVVEGAEQTYVSQQVGGFVTTDPDPMYMNGTLLSNVFQTLSEAIPGTGNELVLTLTSITDGGDEAFAFRNLTVEGNVGDVLAGDANGDGWVDGLDYLEWASNFGLTGPPDPSVAQGNFNGDATVDGLDYLIWAGNYGDHVGGTAVPEPTAVVLMVMGLAGVAIRRRGA
ncbi:MAG: PEP-CTERM sorting domain-containing protein, partial [Planctomycetales bacterium]|nr:PEP-CTERM sorting domain-containing protein [Planctomycetales bacterium]